MRHPLRSARQAALLLGLCVIGAAAPVRAQSSATQADAGVVPDQPPAASSTARADAPSGAPVAALDSAIERAYRGLETRLKRKPDGSYAYVGSGFNAQIDAFGGLTMKDKFVEVRFVAKPAPIDDHNWVLYFLRIRFDLFARIDKAFGNDPFRSERRSFLNETRELRELLLERNAETALDRMLQGLWKLAAMSIREKKERLHAIWSECGTDEYGLRSRARIEAFIRERCPRGSACEYTDAELARLAASAPKGQARFTPYESE